MKDLPHHIKKLNRNVLRSLHREEQQEEVFTPTPPRKQTERQIKKQAKERVRQARLQRAALPPTPDEQNRMMKRRTPVFDRINNAKPKGAKRSSKKIPPLSS
jgi:hypothetical protein